MHRLTDVTVSAEAVEGVAPVELPPDMLDGQLRGELVERARRAITEVLA